MVRVEPSQWVTSVRVPLNKVEDEPAVKQLVAPEHDTPHRSLDAGPGAPGLATIDQVAPFHCSTNVWVIPAFGSMKSPTAEQLLTLTQETLRSSLSRGSGLATIDQPLPFQCSTSVRRPE